MPYNNQCCAGVAHLVERDLAKVEVASSSLVARSKKKDTRRGVFLFGAALLLRKSGGLKRTDYRNIQRRSQIGAAADQMTAAHRCP